MAGKRMRSLRTYTAARALMAAVALSPLAKAEEESREKALKYGFNWEKQLGC